MSRTITIVAGAVLALHGLIHLMGTAVYMKLAPVEGLPYKTALLDGRWEVGETGMWVFGALWGVAALAFVVAALAWWTGWSGWQGLLAATALFSLALTALDWKAALMGALVDVAILALLWAAPRWGALAG